MSAALCPRRSRIQLFELQHVTSKIDCDYPKNRTTEHLHFQPASLCFPYFVKSQLDIKYIDTAMENMNESLIPVLVSLCKVVASPLGHLGFLLQVPSWIPNKPMINHTDYYVVFIVIVFMAVAE